MTPDMKEIADKIFGDINLMDSDKRYLALHLAEEVAELFPQVNGNTKVETVKAMGSEIVVSEFDKFPEEMELQQIRARFKIEWRKAFHRIWGEEFEGTKMGEDAFERAFRKLPVKSGIKFRKYHFHEWTGEIDGCGRGSKAVRAYGLFAYDPLGDTLYCHGVEIVEI